MAPNDDHIAGKWKALSGIEPKNWETLIGGDDSIDKVLREYLVHYGQRVEAVVDSYNDMPKTQGYSLSLFPPDELFFSQTGLEIGNPFKYKVTDFLYARSGLDLGWIHERESAYMGYVAVATDEGARFLGRRDILICWRGTMLFEEWMEDADYLIQVHASDLFGNSPAKVHQGFLHVYTRKTPDDYSPTDPNKDYTQNSAREQVLAAVRKHVDYYGKLNETVSITVAGHSLGHIMGAAIATLNSMDIVSNGYNKPSTGSDIVIPVTAFVSGCPRVGNKDFQKLFDSMSDDLHLLNIQNTGDPIPDHPESSEYVGTVLNIDVTKTKDLKPEANNVWPGPHMPNNYLYAIASSQGKDKVPMAIDSFDMAIVNKNDDYLQDSFKVPKCWFQSLVKHGMDQLEDTGKWEQHYDYVPPVPAPVTIIPPN